MVQHKIECADDLPQLLELQAAAEKIGCVVVGADWAGEEFVIRDKWDTEGKHEETVYYNEENDCFAPSLPDYCGPDSVLSEAGFPHKQRNPRPKSRCISGIVIDFPRLAPQKTPKEFEAEVLEAVARVVAKHFPTAVGVRDWRDDSPVVKIGRGN